MYPDWGDLMEKTVRMLEFDKVKQRLKSYTVTYQGAEKAEKLMPITDFQTVNNLLQETSEAVELIRQNRLKLESCGNLIPYLERAAKEGVLSPLELIEIANFLRSLSKVRSAFLKMEDEEKYPGIYRIIRNLKIFPSLVNELDRCLTPQGEIKDSASSLLFTLRVEEKKLQEKIRNSLESYLRSPQYQKFLQENLITVRQNRYVLPVKREFRHQIQGIVHDQSSTGMTLFIEPLAVFELNNKLREIKGQIEEEIEKILGKLTSLIAAHKEELEANYYFYCQLDFIFARGLLSLSYKGIKPLLNNQGFLNIRRGRHPFLPPDKVVPIDIHLGKDFNILVITGPNTGGKTVTLKTVGIFALMAQSGLHIPAEEGTELCIFKYIGADIGDEQNIEQNLSTFSGHVTNIIEILKKADSDSLVLLDEVGAGTDPSEGAALAMAILEKLYTAGSKTLATTHINDLKVFAHLNKGMENASMEFDPATLAPTFRLLIGIPGQSNALNVAARLGMDTEIVNRARSFMSKEFLDLEKAVIELEEEKRKLAGEREKVEVMKVELDHLLQETEREYRELEEKKMSILQKAREEAVGIVRETSRKVNEILKKLYQAEREERRSVLIEGEKARKLLKELRSELLAREIEPASTDNSFRKPLKMEEIKEGMQVYIKSLRSKGKVVRIQPEKEIQVQAGKLRVTTGVEDLEIYPPEGLQEQKNGSQLKRDSFWQDKKNLSFLWEKTASTHPAIDLRGLTSEEAILKVDKHLDDSLLAGLDYVEIIHGKGTGRLRKAVHEYLKTKNQVENYRFGDENEGGVGVTIVKLKKNSSP